MTLSAEPTADIYGAFLARPFPAHPDATWVGVGRPCQLRFRDDSAARGAALPCGTHYAENTSRPLGAARVDG